MSNFATARKNMVDCQISPSGIIDQKILEAFETVPREQYVTAALTSVAYKDHDIVFDDGRFILDPTTHARMIEALELNEDSVVLDIGHAGGYSSAILSPLASTVMALEQKQKYITAAEKTWLEHGICNVVAFKNNLSKGVPEHAPYSNIILNGCVSEVPTKLVEQLDVGGKMVLIVRRPGQVMGEATLIKSSGSGNFSSVVLFESSAPYLPGFEPEPSFNF
ncbi:protein-L-isoaspartate O-methyltransferase [Alphaproteobacteria bacterium]|nr:protein-L-isoaspartate O-methyltransferase [Alphaproteobacteria bacterium]